MRISQHRSSSRGRTGYLAPQFGQTAFNVTHCSLEDGCGLLKRAAMPDQSLQVTIILLRPGRFCLAHAFNPLKRACRGMPSRVTS